MTLAFSAALQSRPFRLVVTGISAAGLFVVLASLFANAGAPPLLAAPIAYVIVFAFAYLTQRSWTFAGEQAHAVAFPRYLALQLGCAALSGVVSHVAAEWCGAAPLTMSAVAVTITSAASYVVSSRWVFARSGGR